MSNENVRSRDHCTQREAKHPEPIRGPTRGRGLISCLGHALADQALHNRERSMPIDTSIG